MDKYDVDGKLKMRELAGNPALTDVMLEQAGLAIEVFSEAVSLLTRPFYISI